MEQEYRIILKRAIPDPNVPSGQSYEIIEWIDIFAESEYEAAIIAGQHAEINNCYYELVLI